jgi:hypothetical protein
MWLRGSHFGAWLGAKALQLQGVAAQLTLPSGMHVFISRDGKQWET